MEKRRKSRAFGSTSAVHAKKGAEAARFYRMEKAQALSLARNGNCKAALHALVDASNYYGRMFAHGRSRKVGKREGTTHRGRVYGLMTTVFKLCRIG